jgi:iron complex transport system substrate-binding protein
VASVVPAATDLILSMDAGEHLIGVSNYEPANPLLKAMPRVGDYHGVDWEQLARLRPDLLITSRNAKDLPETFIERARALKLRLVTVHIDRLSEIFTAIERLGTELNEPAKAAALQQQLRSRLEAVRRRVVGKALVPTLLVLDEQHTFVAGPRNYLDDILTIAGGSNLASNLNKDYPTVDNELIVKLNPACIIQLLPDAPPQVVQAALARWASLPTVDAVKTGRIVIHTDPYVLLPSAHVADVCEKFEQALHGAATRDEP